jgi:hypothetical protein
MSAGGIAHVHAQGGGGGLGVKHGFEPGQPAELAGEAAARLKTAMSVAGEEEWQVKDRRRRRFAATGGEQEQA